jgi:hypothetical protein
MHASSSSITGTVTALITNRTVTTLNYIHLLARQTIKENGESLLAMKCPKSVAVDTISSLGIVMERIVSKFFSVSVLLGKLRKNCGFNSPAHAAKAETKGQQRKMYIVF